MVQVQRKRWTNSDRYLLNGVGSMITARNKIVHGRLVDDINEVYVELVRARAIFERLFVNFLNCTDFDCPGYPQMIIAQHEDKRSRASKQASGRDRSSEPA